jgi:tripartite-type tricarboxylate transporter receptor subunit TctC
MAEKLIALAEHLRWHSSLPPRLQSDIQVFLEVPIGAMSQTKAGKIRGLAILAKERVPATADIPTIEQSGGPALEASS